MSKRLPRITDEHTISVTLKFLTSGVKWKNGEKVLTDYDLDIIVRSSVTLNEFLEAVGEGLEKWCRELAPDVQLQEQELELRVPESELSREEKKKKERRDEEIADQIQCTNALDRAKGNRQTHTYEGGKDAEPQDYARCSWNIFQKCYRAYLADLIGENDPKILRDGVKVDEGAKGVLSAADHGPKTLAELGFVSSSCVVFTPTGMGNTMWRLGQVETGALKRGQGIFFRFESPRRNGYGHNFSRLPKYNISERPLKKLDDRPVHILPAGAPPGQGDKKRKLLQMLLIPLASAGVMLAARLMYANSGMGANSMVAMTIAMAASSVIIAVLNAMFQRGENKEKFRGWKTQYQNYIVATIKDIRKRHEDSRKQLCQLYPGAERRGARGDKSDDGRGGLIEKTLRVSSDIYSRRPEHPDFLRLRLGMAKSGSKLVPSPFEIRGEGGEAVYSDLYYKNLGEDSFSVGKEHGKDDKNAGKLIDLPADIAETYAYLDEAPVMLSMLECSALGMVVQQSDADFMPALDDILLDLCFHHAPDDLQCVILFPKDRKDEGEEASGAGNIFLRQQAISRYKHLPHFRELLGDISPFVFDEESAHLVFNAVLEQLTKRKEAGEGARFPHVLLIVLEEYSLKRHMLSQYLPEYNKDGAVEDRGISFIFCTRREEELPKYCDKVIYRKNNGETYLKPHVQRIAGTESEYAYSPDSEWKVNGAAKRNVPQPRQQAFHVLSALQYERVAQGADIPENVDLYMVMEQNTEGRPWNRNALEDSIRGQWTNEQDSDRLSVPVGLKAGGVVQLDLHENGDGPHMLVAGTTGSGKTETILSYLLGLCSTYSPNKVNLLLMDMKGAGFVKRIGALPHVVGCVSDIDLDGTGLSTQYMLRRFLRAMQSEVDNRKKLLNRMGVDSITGYTKAKGAPEDHLENLRKASGKAHESGENEKARSVVVDSVEDIQAMPHMPHLFLVIDEFTELMRFSADNGDVDFKSEITSLARIGRSLGFHIILISQNIENAITPDIRVNSRARLCLRVATREASKEMIGSDVAASAHMPGNGRAYMLIGTGSRFEYFQTGYSGANADGSSRQPLQIAQLAQSGMNRMFYDSTEKRGANKVSQTQLQAIVNAIQKVFDEPGSGYQHPAKILQPPLARVLYRNTDRKEETGHGSKA